MANRYGRLVAILVLVYALLSIWLKHGGKIKPPH
jgi:hypothetical protein